MIDGGTHTNDGTPNLTLSAVGASEMYISNTAGCSSGGSWTSYATSSSGWTLGQSNATATVYVKYRDEAHNETSCVNDTIVHDDQDPTSPSIVIDGGTHTNDGTPDLTLAATGASEMFITNVGGCSVGGSWSSYATSYSGWTLGQSNGTATVYVKYRDEAHNETSCVNDTIVHDNQAPTSPSIVIAGGAPHTQDSSPDLMLSATSASEMYVTNTSGCGAGGTWETYGTSKSNWSLGQTNALATVYIKYRDEAHNETSCINDTIVHDDQAPTSTAITIDGGTHIANTSVNLTLAATGASEMYVTNTSGCGSGGTWLAYMTTYSGWTLGQTNSTATVYIKYRDPVGNVSSCINDTIVHDSIPPTSGSLSISSGSSYTTSSTVTLSPSATGASEMYVTNTSGCLSGGSWETYSTTKTGWSLGQSNATATVFVRYRDEANNPTSCYNDTIVHDNTAPSVPGSFNDGVKTTNDSTSPSLSWNASTDSGSGISHYEIALGTTSGATNIQSWTNIGDVTSGQHTSLALTLGSTYYSSIRAVDAAGNTSSAANGDGFQYLLQPQITSGLWHHCYMFNDGKLKCWGRGTYGVLGYGDELYRGRAAGEMGANLPYVDLGTNRTAKMIAAYSYGTCAILDTDDLKCWGANWDGAAGLGHSNEIGSGANEMGDNLAVVDLGTNRTAKYIAGGVTSMCAILDNDDLKCWGNGWNGQTGQGHTNDIGDGANEMGDNLPAIDLGTNRYPVKLDGGYYHYCAILDNNDLKCWGDNNQGQLGLEDTTKRGDGANEMGDNLPVVDLGTNRYAIDISVGVEGTCAVLDNGDAKCWGDNDAGELGRGNITARGYSSGHMGDGLAAIDLGTNRSAKKITLAWGHTNNVESTACAIMDNDQVKCWGENEEGALGIGSTTDKGDNSGEMGDNLSQVSLGTNRHAVQISNGEHSVCVLLDNDGVKCWGSGTVGQTGQETTNHIGDGANEMGDNLPEIDLD